MPRVCHTRQLCDGGMSEFLDSIQTLFKFKAPIFVAVLEGILVTQGDIDLPSDLSACLSIPVIKEFLRGPHQASMVTQIASLFS
jgi:hypothetical protein